MLLGKIFKNMKIIIRTFKKKIFIVETLGPIFAIIATAALILYIGSFIQPEKSSKILPTTARTVTIQHNYNRDKTDF